MCESLGSPGNSQRLTSKDVINSTATRQQVGHVLLSPAAPLSALVTPRKLLLAGPQVHVYEVLDGEQGKSGVVLWVGRWRNQCLWYSMKRTVCSVLRGRDTIEMMFGLKERSRLLEFLKLHTPSV